jgi:hypothetical protein
MRLAAIARADRRGLKQALKIICPDWIPGSGSPGVPNLEYTRTHAPGWRAVSVTVGKILADYDVSPADIEGLAILFEATEPKEATIPDDSLQTIAGEIVLRNELTEEDRPSGEWALICGFSDDTFRNRMSTEAKGPTWRIVESGSQRYRVHVEDLPQKFRGSKKQRDEFLKLSKD